MQTCRHTLHTYIIAYMFTYVLTYIHTCCACIMRAAKASKEAGETIATNTLFSTVDFPWLSFFNTVCFPRLPTMFRR